MRTISRRALAMGALLTVLTSGCRDDRTPVQGIRVMTQNVYYGFDVGPLMASENPEEIPLLAAQAFQELLSTRFDERAEAIADQIEREQPHLIGLQEVALIRIQSPGDAVLGGAAPAETVLFDHLQILLSALAARGLDYRVAGKVENVDVELPMIVDPETFSFDDVRLTDFDVVLARGDVATSNVTSANFQATLAVPSLGIEVKRGYVAMDAQLAGGWSCRFATTHLEDTPFPDVQLAQAQELAAALSTETKPVILVGDFNSPAPSGGTCAFLESQGYVDAWARRLGGDSGEGLTWGHDSNLRNEAVPFTLRIDLGSVHAPDRSGARAGLPSARAGVDLRPHLRR
jgi:hypothetical protein